MSGDPVPRCEFESKKLLLRLDFTIPAEVGAIAPVVEGVLDIARRMGCAPGKEMEIETALRESLANVILHGAQNDPTKKVQCCVVCDESRGMLSPVRAESLFSSHGRGIYLIQPVNGRGPVRARRHGNPHAEVRRQPV